MKTSRPYTLREIAEFIVAGFDMPAPQRREKWPELSKLSDQVHKRWEQETNHGRRHSPNAAFVVSMSDAQRYWFEVPLLRAALEGDE